MGIKQFISKATTVVGDVFARRVYRFDVQLDTARTQITKAIDFTKLASILAAIEDGDAARMVKLVEEMRAWDTRFKGMLDTRRNALTGLPWRIVSASETGDVADKALADAAAKYVSEILGNMEEFDDALEWLAKAIGANIALLELIWRDGRLVDIVRVLGSRLVINYQQSPDVRIITAAEPMGERLPAGKLVVHTPEGGDELPFADCIGRSVAFLFVIKKLAIIDWFTFCEIFGMPVRIGTYEPGAKPAEIAALVKMMKNLSTKAWGIFSKAVQLEFKEASRQGEAPFERIVRWADESTAIAVLGQTLTTSIGETGGAMAAAKVHDEVRSDILSADIKAEARTVRRQIIAPMVAARWPGVRVPLPCFERETQDPVDVQMMATVIESASQRIGLAVPTDWAHETLGIPKPTEGETTIARIPQATDNPFSEPEEFV